MGHGKVLEDGMCQQVSHFLLSFVFCVLTNDLAGPDGHASVQ